MIKMLDQIIGAKMVFRIVSETTIKPFFTPHSRI